MERNAIYTHTFKRKYSSLLKDYEWHSIFAMRLLSLTTILTDERCREEVVYNRIKRQVDLINSLYCPCPPRVFDLRFITNPHPYLITAGQAKVGILVKISEKTKKEAESQAWIFAKELIALLNGSLEDYEFVAVNNEEDFLSFWKPFDLKHIAEIRRRELLVSLETLQRSPSLSQIGKSPALASSGELVYFIHSFIPTLNTFARLLRIMLLLRQPVLFSTAISPVSLTKEELEALNHEISKCETFRKLGRSLQPIYEQRAILLGQGLERQLSRLQDAPFLLKIQVGSQVPIPYTLMESVGVEITSFVGEKSSQMEEATGGYDVIYPNSIEEEQKTIENMDNLDFEYWGPTFAPPNMKRIKFLVDAREANCAFCFPIAVNNELMGLNVRLICSVPVPREVALLGESKIREKLLLGKNIYLGIPQDVFISDNDRQHHLYCVGQTGTGKTTLLKTMILEDIYSGAGVIVIDPHGDLFRELLGMVPKKRWDEVVVLDPNDTDFPVGLNLLECPNENQRHFIVREMRAIMERLFEDQYQYKAVEYVGPIFFQHMQMNMLLVMSDPDDPGTLFDFYEIFQHKDYWKKWLPLKWEDSQLKRWVENNLPSMDYLQRYSEGTSFGEYLGSKFEDFMFDPKLRFIFGQKHSTINLREIMDNGKILLVNLAKGELTEANSRFLGMVLMAKIMASAMERVNIPVSKRRPFYLYVDEFQSIATLSFVNLLSEARKFGLGLVLANQFLSQIKDQRIVQSIFGNVCTLISFRVGRDDAELLEPHFLPVFNNYHLSNLPNWQACIKTSVYGQVVSPFTLNTLLPSERADPKTAEEVRYRSRARYGRPRKEVEEEMLKVRGS